VNLGRLFFLRSFIEMRQLVVVTPILVNLGCLIALKIQKYRLASGDIKEGIMPVQYLEVPVGNLAR